MALSLVGGAALSASFNVLLDKLASPEVVGFFKSGRKLNNKLLEKLKITMITVSGLLNDAEEKQMMNRDVQRWLDELKDAAYHADDVLDAIAYESLRKESKAKELKKPIDQMRKILCCLNLAAHHKEKRELNGKLEGIIETLEYLVKQNATLGLIGKDVTHIPHAGRIPTTSLVDDHLYVRNHEKAQLVQLLLCFEVANVKPFDLISISGLGGIGKTTLAQLAYNDERISRWFHFKVWLCASETFDVRRLTEDILKSNSGGKQCGDMTDDQLHKELEKAVEGQKILLVLDDVWRVDTSQWDFLLRPFKSVAKGSKIVVTTRDEKMASIESMLLVHPIHVRLEKLTGDDPWSLFAVHAFGQEDPSVYPELNRIGKDIVKKCDGLPLAIQAVGRLLSCSRDVLKWEEILKSSYWDQALIDAKILPALKLSYHYMPSHLKQCFAYCAIIPKDYAFKKEVLVHLWMAEGLLTQDRESIEMEEIGEKCVQDLVSRSFLQQSNDDPRLLSMHDLVNDLARYVSGEFCCRLEENERSRMATVKTRYLSFDERANSDTVKEQIQEAKFLRTIFQLSVYASHGEIMEAYLPSLRALRLPLDFSSSDTSPWEWTHSIGKFKHLRYMDLSCWDIRGLPDDVCNLYSLQTLILRGCSRLVELPSLLGNLKNLRYLDLHGTPNIVGLPTTMNGLKNLRHLDIRGTRISEMPPQVGQLTRLVVLTDFFIGKEKSYSIAELGPLVHLKGELCIWNLENVVDPSHAIGANLKGKRYIEKLELRWGDYDKIPFRAKLEQLRPTTYLKALWVHNYPGVRIPNWLGEPCFSELISLHLRGGRHCSELPALGQLEQLKELEIECFDSILRVGPEFYGNSGNKRAFPSLEKLAILSCREFRSFQLGPMKNLRSFELRDCPVFDSLYCGGDEEGPLTSLHSFWIDGCSSFISFPGQGLRAPNLRKLSLENLKAFEWLPNHMHSLLPSLTELRLVNCTKLRSFPEGGLPSSIEKLAIFLCDGIESSPEGGFPTKLKMLEIVYCGKLVGDRKNWGLQALQSLSYLWILGCEEVLESFPEETLLPPSLNTLLLSSFKHLKSLDYKGLEHLTALKELDVSFCPELQSLPEEGLPSSLQDLVLNYCSKTLEERCQENGGEWHKISHIPRITVNYNEIKPRQSTQVRDCLAYVDSSDQAVS
ncbi:hypothetical protein Tsubulata_903813 [Turnera subulata]|uniref:Disease resistance RPP13-like protein 1 n=1 Tax=Turnera subulata TaxID=218843 RepID=A0A9Q0GH21_9ROSI|nr:hypothetical protein Tsubulata_903813 [Turnera subulata]